MSFYADTSFLLALIGQDRNTPLAQAEIRRLGFAPVIPWTEFGALEFNNAARALVFQRRLDPAGLASVEKRLQSCLSLGILRSENLAAHIHYLEAERLSARHTCQSGARTLDVLHVAAALALKTTGFLTFDLRQANCARAAGLPIGPS